MAYLNPTEQWRLARPGSIPLSSWAPGDISDVTKTGTGSATMTASGYPLDAAAVRVRCFVAGEPGGAARVKVSVDGGVTYPGGLLAVPLDDGLSQPLTCAGEVSLSFTAGAAPSFVIGDVFAFSTTASPEILAQIDAAGAEADGYFADVFKLPLSAWGMDIKRAVGLLARDNLTANRGFADYETFSKARKEAERWLERVALGELQPSVTEAAGGGVVFPSFMKARKAFGTDWRI